jgi:hypothetical protein
VERRERAERGREVEEVSEGGQLRLGKVSGAKPRRDFITSDFCFLRVTGMEL